MNSGKAESKGVRHLDLLVVFISLIAPFFLAVLISGQFSVLPVKLRVENPVEDLYSLDRAMVLRVNVTNEGGRAIVPYFFVFWSGIPNNAFVPWSYESSPIALPGLSSRVYTIRASDPNRAIPNGSFFHVRLYDEGTQEYAFSRVEKLGFPRSPILKNPAFLYWSAPADQSSRPWAWTVDSLAGPNDTHSLSPSVSNGTRIRMAVSEDGRDDPTGRTAIYLSQGLDARAVGFLRNSTLRFPVRPGFSYQADPISRYPLAFSGIEVDDGNDLVRLVFSCCTQGVIPLPHQQIIVFNEPEGEVSILTLDLSVLLGSLRPGRVWVFSLVVSTSQFSPGSYVTEFGALEIA